MQGPGSNATEPGLRGALLALGALGGTAAQLQLAALWPRGDAALLAGGALLLAATAWRWRRRWPGALGLVLALAAAAFVGTNERARWRLADALPAALEGQDLQVTGVIAQLPQVSASGTRFVFATEAATLRGQPVTVPQRVSVGWYANSDDTALLDGPPEPLRAGQRWRLTLRLRQPHGLMNPRGFDLELWLFEQGIRAGGAVRTGPTARNRKLADEVAFPVERWRQRLRDALQSRVADPVAAGVLAALVVGDQAAIARAEWDLFRTTGVAHLMSISGLHVTMFAWLAGLLVGAAWRRWPKAMLAWPAPQAARWGGLLLAAGYALLAGWGVPAQRTVWMLAAVALLRGAGLRWPLPAVLLAAALVVVAADPWALLQPGFWLSFVAVALLAVSEPAQRPAPPTAAERAGTRWHQRARTAIAGGLRTQLVATIGLAPLTMLFFQQVSLVGFAANLVAIPAVTLLITPLALLGVLLPPLWWLAALLVQGLMAWLQWLSTWPLATWSAAAAPAWAAASGLLAALLAVLPLPWRLRMLALPLMLPLLWPAVPRPAPGRFELVGADVGQGTAVLVRTAGHLLVYDSGPSYSADADAGGRVLLPLLRTRGETAIDLLMISHRDSDHVGGAASLLAAVPVRLLSSSLEETHPLRAGRLPHRPCSAGQSWVWDGVRFDVLHPLAGDLALPLRPNALSCVLRVQGEAGSVLLTGDIEAAQEAALLQRDAASLHSDVLLVPHHGSRTSSTPAFLDAVAPRTALAQAAYRSRFGHPAPAVEQRYLDRGIEFLRSDRCGAWTLRADGTAVCEREVARRYWHHPMETAATAAPCTDATGAVARSLQPTQHPPPRQEPNPCPSTSR